MESMMPRSDWEAAGCCEEDAAGCSDEELFVAIAGKAWRYVEKREFDSCCSENERQDAGEWLDARRAGTTPDGLARTVDS
jgi:hypothetical protein